MSVASEFAPDVYIPRQARTFGSSALALDAWPEQVAPRPRHLRAVPEPLDDWSSATTAPLRRQPPVTRPLHVTRRGVAALVGLAVALGAAIVVLAWQFRPADSPAPVAVGGVSGVTVRAGDTLWSIASRVAPQADPRSEIELIQRLNGLTNVDLVAGQLLRVR
jgi:hypothetical protein